MTQEEFLAEQMYTYNWSGIVDENSVYYVSINGEYTILSDAWEPWIMKVTDRKGRVTFIEDDALSQWLANEAQPDYFDVCYISM